jgi:hypothetical protein
MALSDADLAKLELRRAGVVEELLLLAGQVKDVCVEDFGSIADGLVAQIDGIRALLLGVRPR